VGSGADGEPAAITVDEVELPQIAIAAGGEIAVLPRRPAAKIALTSKPDVVSGGSAELDAVTIGEAELRETWISAAGETGV